MPLIAYPSALPGPSAGWAAVLRERAARSALPGNPQARRRWRDQIADVTSATWHYSAAEMATWREWFHETLVDGQLWFAKEAPGPGGFIDRVMRFRPPSVRVQPLGNGACRVTAQLEVRGRSAPPRTTDIWLLDNFNGAEDASIDGRVPDVSPGNLPWELTLSSIVLTGAGQAVSGSSGDGRARIDLSGGPLVLTRPFAMELVATPFSAPVIEAAEFILEAPGDYYLKLSIGNDDEDSFSARVEHELGSSSHAITHDQHALRVVVNADDTASVLVDGVEVASIPYTPPATADIVRLYLSSEPGGSVSVSRVLLEYLGD
jgi:hypothetical protein